ncbi:MAG: hypothetical protein R6V52_01750, partial [Bacteroidales bacterium]
MATNGYEWRRSATNGDSVANDVADEETELLPIYKSLELQKDPGYVDAITHPVEGKRATARVWAHYKTKYPFGMAYIKCESHIYPLLASGIREEELIGIIQRSRGLLQNAKPWELFDGIRNQKQKTGGLTDDTERIREAKRQQQAEARKREQETLKENEKANLD